MEENKKLSSEEQRRLMKEQYKQDLRMRKEFLDKVNELKKQEPVLKALESMQVEDDSDEWIAKLNQETALTEAKLEMALENAPIGDGSEPKVEAVELSDEELKKIQAAEMVAKMKAEMEGGSEGTESKQKGPGEDSQGDDRPSRKMLDGLV